MFILCNKILFPPPRVELTHLGYNKAPLLLLNVLVALTPIEGLWPLSTPAATGWAVTRLRRVYTQAIIIIKSPFFFGEG